MVYRQPQKIIHCVTTSSGGGGKLFLKIEFREGNGYEGFSINGIGHMHLSNPIFKLYIKGYQHCKDVN